MQHHTHTKEKKKIRTTEQQIKRKKPKLPQCTFRQDTQACNAERRFFLLKPISYANLGSDRRFAAEVRMRGEDEDEVASTPRKVKARRGKKKPRNDGGMTLKSEPLIF